MLISHALIRRMLPTPRGSAGNALNNDSHWHLMLRSLEKNRYSLEELTTFYLESKVNAGTSEDFSRNYMTNVGLDRFFRDSLELSEH
jgi:hypothetical protein